MKTTRPPSPQAQTAPQRHDCRCGWRVLLANTVVTSEPRQSERRRCRARGETSQANSYAPHSSLQIPVISQNYSATTLERTNPTHHKRACLARAREQRGAGAGGGTEKREMNTRPAWSVCGREAGHRHLGACHVAPYSVEQCLVAEVRR